MKIFWILVLAMVLALGILYFPSWTVFSLYGLIVAVGAGVVIHRTGGWVLLVAALLGIQVLNFAPGFLGVGQGRSWDVSFVPWAFALAWPLSNLLKVLEGDFKSKKIKVSAFSQVLFYLVLTVLAVAPLWLYPLPLGEAAPQLFVVVAASFFLGNRGPAFFFFAGFFGWLVVTNPLSLGFFDPSLFLYGLPAGFMGMALHFFRK